MRSRLRVCLTRDAVGAAPAGFPRPERPPPTRRSSIFGRPFPAWPAPLPRNTPTRPWQPTCQCAGRFPHHAETPTSFRGPLNLPCHQNRCQGWIKRTFEAVDRFDSIRNGRRLDARCARIIVYISLEGLARTQLSTASGVASPVPTKIVFSDAP